MAMMKLSIGRPFYSPAWGSNTVMFSSESGLPVSEEQVKDYLVKCCKYALRHNVYLVPEKFVTLGIQCMCLISPKGKVIGAQQQIFSNPEENVKTNNAIDLITTEFGDIFLAVDNDIYHPEIGKILFNMGASYIFSLQRLDNDDVVDQKMVAGPWNQAQSNNLYVVAGSNNANCICAPKKLTRHGDGFLLKPTDSMTSTINIVTERLESLPLKPLLSRRFYLMHRKDLME